MPVEAPQPQTEAPPPADVAAESPAKLAVRATTSTGTNWVGAFLLFAKGATLHEVSEQLGIPLSKLKAKHRTEDWDRLVQMNRQLAIAPPSSAVAPMSVVVLKDAEKRIEANREAALIVATGLRSHIQKILDTYAQAQIHLLPADIMTLSKAASLIDTSAMLALGDDPSPKILPTQGATRLKDERPITHWHIHTPAQVAGPRLVGSNIRERPVIEGVESVDAITGDADRRVELTPERNEEDVDISVPANCGRAAVDFGKLAKQLRDIPQPDAAAAKGTGIPEFARAG